MPSVVRDIHVDNLLSGRRFLIEWAPNSVSESVTTYEIHRSVTETTGYEKLGEVGPSTNQFIDKVPYTFGVTFFYKVLARDGTGLRSDINATSGVQDMTFDSFEEAPFRATTVTFDSIIKGEVPSGAKDGVNTTFTTASLYRFNSVEVFVSGLALERGVGFTENNDQTTVTLTVAPAPATGVTVNYLKV